MSGGKRPHLRAVRFVTLSVFAAIGIGLAAEDTSAVSGRDTAYRALGAFAGYSWSGVPHTISAEWKVPLITGGPEGHAGTWVGIEAANGNFVQVGTNEDRSGGNFGALDRYTAFWSTNTVGFHPHELNVEVSSGDLVRGSITTRGSGWYVTVEDLTTGLLDGTAVDLTNAGYNQAEFLQEDPTDGRTNVPLPYPQLTTVTLSKLRVNDKVPRLGAADQAWMGTPGVLFQPSEVRANSFTVRGGGALSFYQQQFLDDVGPRNTAAEAFDKLESAWTTRPTTPAMALRELAAYARADRFYASALRAQHWPANAAKDVDDLAEADLATLKVLHRLAASQPHPGDAVKTAHLEVEVDRRHAGLRVRSDLGLPE